MKSHKQKRPKTKKNKELKSTDNPYYCLFSKDDTFPENPPVFMTLDEFIKA